MRLLRKNQKTISYQNYIGKEPVVNKEGFETGEYEVKYTEKRTLKCTITPRSNTNTNINGNTFPGYIGNLTSYEKIILTTDMETGINENTLLFIDQTTEPDYKVSALSKCKTHMAFAVEKIQ